jgi:hypothetical protein
VVGVAVRRGVDGVGAADVHEPRLVFRGVHEQEGREVRFEVATDQGSAFSWSWTSAPYDLGYPGQVKITRESRLWGVGTVTMKVANDYGSFDTGSALTLGTNPTVADAWQQIDREGTLWQHKLSGTGAASVSRLEHMISFVKPAGVG